MLGIVLVITVAKLEPAFGVKGGKSAGGAPAFPAGPGHLFPTRGSLFLQARGELGRAAPGPSRSLVAVAPQIGTESGGGISA